MAKRPALGKGMGALLDSAVQAGRGQYFLCPIEELKPHENQPRKYFDGAKMAELVDSIKEKGVIQPLVVRREQNFYQIIAGERRWRAAQKAGLKEIPVTIQDVSEDWALEIALIENIQREDLNPIEESRAYKYLMDNFDLSQEEVAKRVGKSRSAVTNALRLLRLPQQILEQVESNTLSMGHARALLALEHEEDMHEAAEQIGKNKLSVRETEKLVKKIKIFDHAGAEQKVKQSVDPELLRLEDILRKNLGTKVKISPKGNGGKIEITYTNSSELERLLDYLNLV
ncbi:MAG: ParB/RepB/Spo0J family partition protein [Desulfuromonadaceae bacterium]|nr:ParB/RepB/Spo0J family partition protein [Desulfuromonadaceae bacterium]